MDPYTPIYTHIYPYIPIFTPIYTHVYLYFPPRALSCLYIPVYTYTYLVCTYTYPCECTHVPRPPKVKTLHGLSPDKSLEVSLPSEERENENTSTPAKKKTSELEMSETIRNQLIESLIPCDSCVALFEYEKDIAYLAWCLSIQKGAANCSFSQPGPDTGPAD